jgi:predicted nucleic-acid-binding protein
MIGLDTNILVRYLTQEDAAQSRKAREIIERRLTAESPGFVSVVVMVETVWVLERAYRFSSEQIVAAVEGILGADELAVENEQQVFSAIAAVKEGRGSFADALIAALAVQAGCSHVLTFDEKALRLASFERA